MHFFSVDVEEHFHANVFGTVAPPSTWDHHPTRVVPNTQCLLDLLARHDVRGTFFTLGWVADRHPDLVRAIAAAGHEVASHGWWHRRVTTQTPDQFRDDVRRSKALLEDLTGRAVLGYRAPSYSIVPGREWALDVLLETGYRYDSSLFPIARSGYGYPGTPTEPHRVTRPAGSLWEFPPATTRVLGLLVPAAGGGYLRQFPLGVIRRAFRERDRTGSPGMFYVHPWEVDPEQPRLPVPFLSRVRHYRGLTTVLPRLEQLLAEFRFGTVAAWLGEREPSLA